MTHANPPPPWWADDLLPSVPLQFGQWGVQRVPRGVRPHEPEPTAGLSQTAQRLIDDRDGAILWVWWPEHDYLISPYEVPDLAQAVAQRDHGLLARRRRVAIGWSVITAIGAAGLAWLVLAPPAQGVDRGVLILGLIGLAHVFDAGPVSLVRITLDQRRLVRDPASYRRKAAAALRLPVWLSRRPARSATLLATVIAALFVMQMHDPLAAIQGFGLVHQSVLEGDWWRLISCAGIHGSLGHALLNALAGLALANILERLSHWGVVMSVFLGATLCGSLASLALSPVPISVGASGGILGLAGAILGLATRRKELREAGLSGNILRWMALIALIGVLGWQAIDNAAHAGGLLGGYLIGLIAVPRTEDTWPADRGPLAEWIGPVVTGGLIAMALWIANGLAIG